MTDPTIFTTGDSNGQIGAESRPGSASGIAVESADDFVLSTGTAVTGATFTGVLNPSGTPVSNIVSIDIEIFREYPGLSDKGRAIQVPTRANSPSDNALDLRDSASGGLNFTTTILSDNIIVPISIFSTQNTFYGGISTEVQFSANFTQPLLLPAGHFFFVPQVLLNNGEFLWLSAPRPIVPPGTPFSPDLEGWIRSAAIAPDWVRIGTDVLGRSLASPPTFNGAFSLSGQGLPPGGTAVFDPSWSIVATGDFNGNGAADLVWQNQTTKLVEIHELIGTTTIGGGAIPNSPFDSSWRVVGSGDFNGDGRSDLVYRRADGFAEVQFLNGNTGIGGGLILNNPFDPNWQMIGTGDFNGDGRSDLVWRRASDGLMEIQYLKGTVAVGGGVIQNNPFDPTWNVVATGDFNGDGKADLVWQHQGDGLTEIQFMNGTTPIGGGLILNSPFGPDWHVAGVGDFNGDGLSDLVWEHSGDNLVEVQFLTGITAIGGGAIANSPFDSDWSIAGTGDFNADGMTDLVYRRASDGLTEIQFLHGSTGIGGGVAAIGSHNIF